MPCPYFLPREPLDSGGWDPPPRLPLIECWAGSCLAHPDKPFEPEESITRDHCNHGYARGACSRFPADAPHDAVRFSALPQSDPALKVIYVLEREHVPAAHAPIDRVTPGSILAAQAEAFLASWERLTQRTHAAAQGKF